MAPSAGACRQSGRASSIPNAVTVVGSSDSKKTYTELANLHTTGYKVPLQGRKGKRVRHWFAANFDIYFKVDLKFLTVEPRPFMGLAADKWALSGRDAAIQEQAASTLQRVWAKR